MTKTYLHAFIAMRYMAALPLSAVPAAVCAILYYKMRIPSLKILGIILTIVLAGVLICYYGEKFTIRPRLAKIRESSDYDQSVIIGTSFVRADRMLVYEKGKLKELQLAEIQRIHGEPAKKDHYWLTLESAAVSASVVTSSRAQAERLAGLISARNPAVSLDGITAGGDGLLEHLESGK